MIPSISVLAKHIARHRIFPTNTCAASRHVESVAYMLARGEALDDRQWLAESMLVVVDSLYKARTALLAIRPPSIPESEGWWWETPKGHGFVRTAKRRRGA